jgi:hypothetical protein
MAQDKIVYWFYVKHLEEPGRYFKVKEVARALDMNYSQCLNQLKKLAVFDWLKTFNPESIFINGYAKNLYKLHSNKVNRCKIMFSVDKTVYSYQNTTNINTYIPGSKIEEEKSLGMGKVL